MSLLIKLAAYLFGAFAFLAALVTPTQSVINTTATSTPPLATTTSASAPVATTSPKVVKKKPSPAPLPQPIPEPTIISVPLPPLVPITPRLSWNEINEKTRAALVNIICTTKRGGSFNPVSGSGVIIDPRGVILTNAHVAEYFLLKDYLVQNFVECLIRTGAPATNSYRARLLYIAPQWIEKNAAKLTEEEATGTGENDFALLLIQESTRLDTPLPSLFPALAVDWRAETLAETGKEKYALVAGYPAGFLGGIAIQRDLNPVSSVAQTGNIFSFVNDRSPDLLEVFGSPLSQEGSSGGAVVGQDGRLIGIIATASVGKTTSERTLHAITPHHIERGFAARNNFLLQEFLAESDLAHLADEFNKNVAPQLKKILENVLTPH